MTTWKLWWQSFICSRSLYSSPTRCQVLTSLQEAHRNPAILEHAGRQHTGREGYKKKKVTKRENKEERECYWKENQETDMPWTLVGGCWHRHGSQWRETEDDKNCRKMIGFGHSGVISNIWKGRFLPLVKVMVKEARLHGNQVNGVEVEEISISKLVI